ncbi:hypothetical protein ACLI4Z_11285 [Natrialbaceae archaeon A-arb3/5]
MAADSDDEQPDDVFRVLSHDLRLLVLDVLEAARTSSSFAAEPLSYSKLADLMGERQGTNFGRDSGNFNSHLRVRLTIYDTR